jgi:hypothetical protein
MDFPAILPQMEASEATDANAPAQTADFVYIERRGHSISH